MKMPIHSSNTTITHMIKTTIIITMWIESRMVMVITIITLVMITMTLVLIIIMVIVINKSITYHSRTNQISH